MLEYHCVKIDGGLYFSLANLPSGNCIKHGYVKRVADWPWSSFSRFVQKGVYDMEWVGGNEGRLGMLGWE
jgi:putative transposase